MVDSSTLQSAAAALLVSLQVAAALQEAVPRGGLLFYYSINSPVTQEIHQQAHPKTRATGKNVGIIFVG
jgi:hypothetical protein